MEEKTYTIPKAAEICGLENGRLREYISRGFIRPRWPADGHGTKNYLNNENLKEIKIFQTLLSFGLNRKIAANVLDCLVHEKQFFKDEDCLVIEIFRKL